MDSVPADVSNSHPINEPSNSPPAEETDRQASASVASRQDNSPHEASPRLSPTGISSWAKNLKISQPFSGNQDDSSSGNVGKSTFSRITSNFGLRLSPKSPVADDSSNETAGQSNLFGTITKGLVDSSKNAVKAVQVKARHVVSQNKRRYQEGGFDLDMTYITENIIAMGFPAGDMSSGFFGYVEGFYRNHMEEVIKFFETHHKDKYKVYNLCSERLYDASLFEGKVASFPFDDHNCPPIQLIISFCQSAYSWLKEDIENVVVVHCKAGMARTGLMISSLLVFLKFFPTAEESMDYYNQKRCVDGKGLVLPSQIRYVKYFERVLTYFNGENPPARRCMLRGFRLHRCPYWIRPSITVSVEKEIEKHAADGLGRVDYALASGGASVVRHSEPYDVGRGNWFLLSAKNGVHPNADKMLKPSFGEPGQCFPLKGSTGFVQIRLRTAIIPEAVTLEHVAKQKSPDHLLLNCNCYSCTQHSHP